MKDKNNYKLLGFTPKPGLTNNPDYFVLYCKALNLKNSWEYLKIKSSKKTTEFLKIVDKKPITVLVYSF